MYLDIIRDLGGGCLCIGSANVGCMAIFLILEAATLFMENRHGKGSELCMGRFQTILASAEIWNWKYHLS